MKIVEMVGPSGVGKTTLKRALLNAGSRSHAHMFDQRAIRLWAIRHRFLRRGLSWLACHGYGPGRALALAAAEVAGPRFRNIAFQGEWDADWSEFMLRALAGVVAAGGAGNALGGRMALMLESLAEVRFARHAATEDGAVLFDEGVLQRGVSLAQAFADGSGESVARYYQTCPLPDRTIILTADPATIETRLRGRRGSSPDHIRLISAAIRATEACSAAMAARQAPIMRLDVSGNGLRDVDRILRFLNDGRVD